MPNWYTKLTDTTTKAVALALFVLALLIGMCAWFFYSYALAAPAFSGNEITFTIQPGQGLKTIARGLEENHLVKSADMAQILMLFYGGERDTKAGMYVFNRAQNVFSVAERIVRSDYGYIPIKLTEPEGDDSYKLTDIVGEKFSQIATSTFEVAAKADEGYLFPQTYFFPPMATQQMIIDEMTQTFTAELKPYEDEIRKSGRSRDDIIKMASILEAEVQTDSDRKMVADLLWRRLDSGMPLEVDSTLGYVLNKTSAELSLSDLHLDNPYNTYKYRGLPPTPISNPGLESILAALRPTPNDYLFYLSDKNGITHFAKTYAEHLENKQKYI